MPTYITPQGKRLQDNSYYWECQNHIRNNCPYCCDFDKTRLIESLSQSNGQIYYSNLKAFLFLFGKAIYEDAKVIIERENRFSPKHLLEIVDNFKLPRKRAKIVTEWLEETGLLPSGTYEIMLSKGFKPTKM